MIVSAPCQISSLSLRNWDLSLLHREVPGGKHQLVECIEFPGHGHMIIMAESDPDARGIQSLDFLRGLIAALGMKISDPERMIHLLHSHLSNLLPGQVHPSIHIIQIREDRTPVNWTSSDPKVFTRFPTVESDSPPQYAATFLVSADASLVRHITKLLDKPAADISTLDAMESIRDLIESSSGSTASISLVHLKRTG